MFQQRQEFGCVELEVEKRLSAPSSCPGVLEYYIEEKEALTKVIDQENMDFLRQLRVLRKRAWGYGCGGAKDMPPNAPGCWVMTPTGCPLHPGDGLRVWTRDEVGEQTYREQMKMNISKFECLVTRGIAFGSHCGAIDVAMHFNPPVPVSAGCWVYTPSGCPKEIPFIKAREHYSRDLTGEQQKGADMDEATCLTTRKLDYDSRCGVDDVKMYWRPETEPPVTPGCFYHTPQGCPKSPLMTIAIDSWQHDTVGDLTIGSDSDELACNSTRKQEWVNFCGTDTVVVQFCPSTGCLSLAARRKLAAEQYLNETIANAARFKTLMTAGKDCNGTEAADNETEPCPGAVQAAFFGLDTNQDGSVTSAELSVAAEANGLVGMGQRIFDLWDEDGSGSLTLCVNPEQGLRPEGNYPFCGAWANTALSPLGIPAAPGSPQAIAQATAAAAVVNGPAGALAAAATSTTTSTTTTTAAAASSLLSLRSKAGLGSRHRRPLELASTSVHKPHSGI